MANSPFGRQRGAGLSRDPLLSSYSGPLAKSLTDDRQQEMREMARLAGTRPGLDPRTGLQMSDRPDPFALDADKLARSYGKRAAFNYLTSDPGVGAGGTAAIDPSSVGAVNGMDLASDTAAGASAGQGLSLGATVGTGLGALGGAMAGRYNAATDPNMSNYKDGFGRYNTMGLSKNAGGTYDLRADVGGGALGGALSFFTNGWAGPVVGPIVKAVHPLAESISRNAITTGDKLGGVGGAMLLDPVGTIASGKYSRGDIALSPLSIAAGPGPVGQKVFKTIKKVDPVAKFISKHCFITTAVCEMFDKPDDCHELTVMRKFRDGWMKENQPYDIIEYYETAPAVVEAVKARKDGDEILKGFYAKYIMPTVEAVEKEDFDTAYTTYRKMIDEATAYANEGAKDE